VLLDLLHQRIKGDLVGFAQRAPESRQIGFEFLMVAGDRR